MTRFALDFRPSPISNRVRNNTTPLAKYVQTVDSFLPFLKPASPLLLRISFVRIRLMNTSRFDAHFTNDQAQAHGYNYDSR